MLCRAPLVDSRSGRPGMPRRSNCPATGSGGRASTRYRSGRGPSCRASRSSRRGRRRSRRRRRAWGSSGRREGCPDATRGPPGRTAPAYPVRRIPVSRAGEATRGPGQGSSRRRGRGCVSISRCAVTSWPRARGRLTRKVAPPPGVSCTSTVPWRASTIEATIERPSPEPRSRACARCRRARSARRCGRGSARGCPRRGR